MAQTSSLTAYAAELSGAMVSLPAMPHARGKVTIFARRLIPDSNRFRLEAIELDANHIERSLKQSWPTQMFHCDRGQYAHGRLLFYQGDDAFGFGVDADQPVTVTSGELDRESIEHLGTHDALTTLATQHLTTVQTLDPRPAVPELPSLAKPLQRASPVVSSATAPPYAKVWVPSPLLGAVFALLGLAICYGAVYDYSIQYPVNSIVAAVAGIALIVSGSLALLVDPQRLRRMTWAVVDAPHRPPAWEIHLGLAVLGAGLIAWGMGYAGSALKFSPVGTQSAAAMGTSIGIKGLLLLATGVALLAYNTVRLIPALSDRGQG